MANKRLSKEKQALVLAALCEGTPINAVSRMFKTGKHAVLRVIREVLFFEPQRRGTDLNGALEFLLRVTRHRAIAVGP